MCDKLRVKISGFIFAFFFMLVAICSQNSCCSWKYNVHIQRKKREAGDHFLPLSEKKKLSQKPASQADCHIDLID